MGTRTAYFVTLFLMALSLGGGWSHVLQIRGKATWPGPLWRTVMETLYRDYATAGAVVEVGSILAAWMLVFFLRGVSPAFWWAVVAAALVSLAFGAWLAFIAPINTVFATWTPATVPADWTGTRDRWEFWHAAIAALKALAFGTLIVAALSQIRVEPFPN